MSDLAPARTARPKGRPKGLKLAEKEPDPKPDPQTPKESIEDQIALDIAKAIAEANAEAATSQPAPVSGPPLSGSEMSGLVFAIQQCWNVPVGLQNDDSNVCYLGY